jgi:glycosyltransferase involved in cell wall biosynthesis
MSERREKKSSSNLLLSIVVPVYNEEECLEAMYERLTRVCLGIDGEYEILFVDDGSRDHSLEILRRLALKDRHVGFYSFSRNFGHESALSCGLSHARGQAIVLIDSDLQDPPELIPQMIELWRKGYDIVHAQRKRREGESILTRITSYAFYRLFRKLSGVNVPNDTGDFRLMDRAVSEAFLQCKERNRFVRGMISWTGYPSIAITYERAARLAGETKYNFFKRFNLAVDAICGVSTVPLRLMTYSGALLTFISFMLGFWIVAQKLFLGLALPGYALLTSGLFFLVGVQLTFMGIIGEYVGRIYREVQARPLYFLNESRRPSIRRDLGLKKSA